MKRKKKWLGIAIPVAILAIIAVAIYQTITYLQTNSMLVMADVMVYVERCGPYLIPAAIVLVAAIVVGIVLRKKLTGRKHFLFEAEAVWAVVLVLIIGVNGICLGPMQYLLNLTLADNDGIDTAAIERASDLASQIAEEGAVLLKNENYLPIDTSTKINVFGWASTNAAYGGGGSGQINAGADCVTLLEGINNAGFETNDELTEFYTEYAAERPAKMSGMPENLAEPYADDYSEQLLESAKEFSDTAMVVITRSGQEAADLPKDMGSVVANATAAADSAAGETQEYEYFNDGDHYLELSIPEKEMVELVCNNFNDVVVVYNGTNTFELGWVDEYDSIKSVLLMPAPGERGFDALGEVLSGTVNPSGHLTDTYLYDLTQAPSFNNFGGYSYENPEEFTFVNYVEGIYSGYKFFETASEEGLINYDETVQYPFGYGLSYTSFEEDISSYTVEGNTINVEVTVTNTGDTAGKDVVELFYSAPYNNGGIEKSSIELLDFDKTEEIQPGESETVSFTFDRESMASYDEGIKVEGGGYILEAGDYEISVRADAHTPIDSVVYNVSNDVIYRENQDGARSTDLVEATNEFIDTAEGDVEYLSRADGFANYEEATAAPDSYVMSEKLQEILVDNSNYEIEINEEDEMPVTGADNGLRTEDMIGLDYDDEQWELLLDQLTVDEMSKLISVGGWQTVAANSVGKSATLETDGPAGFSSFFSSKIGGTAFPSEVLIAQSWNKEICYEMGVCMAEQGQDIGVSGWYAPALNLHRSPFGGRNFEYFSEDSVLSGLLAANIVGGAEENGLYCFVKHFALNDQETNRIGKLCTWANEQSIRETYLKPFEIAVKEGGATAMMSSYTYIGTEWAGTNKALLTDVLRGEWGFCGTVITDYFGGYGYMDADRAIRAGGDLMLTNSGSGDAELDDIESATAVIAMRNAAHNILYTVANSNAYYEGAIHQSWIQMLVIADVIIAAAMLIIQIVIVLIYRRRGVGKTVQVITSEEQNKE